MCTSNVLRLVTPERRLLSLPESPVVSDNFVFVGADGSARVRVHNDAHVTVESGNVSSLGSSDEDPVGILGQVGRFRVGPLFRTDWTPRIPVPAIQIIKKAFDTVDHGILIKKLKHYGVRGVASDWVKSYLSNRKQFVNIDGCSSELLSVICGVPQGSILGPTLFIPYINDICNVSNLAKFILFADDTNVFCAGDNQLKLECILNR